MKIEKDNKKKILKIGALCAIFLSFAWSFTSCSKSDNSTPTTPPRDRGEQQLEDKSALENYLKTHYYNSEHLDTIPNPNTSELVITELQSNEDVPEGHSILMDSIDKKTVNYLYTEYEF